MSDLNTADCIISEKIEHVLPSTVLRADEKVRNSYERFMTPIAGINSVGVLLRSSQILDLYNLTVSAFCIYFQPA